MKIKSLSKIFVRYLLTATIIMVVTLCLNIFLYIIVAFRTIQSSQHPAGASKTIAEEFYEENGTLLLSENGLAKLEEQYVWAMLLGSQGQILWSWQLPEHLNHTYTASEIAAFSKWYLDDYPVVERINDYGLFVVASPQGSMWKYNISDSMKRMNTTLHMIPVTIGINLFFGFFLSIFMGTLFYRSLRGIALGIEQLSEHQAIHLPEKGMTEMLAKQLNRTSDLLTRQREQLERRDNARAAWIGGVSHDIRTPLSLIMGHASALKADGSLTEEQRRQAEIIELQSLQIKHLIEDLNLTSKLEYDMQPLRPVRFHPSRLLRKIVTDFYNQGLSPDHTIDLYIDPAVEQITLNGDTALLARAFRNLIQNSIRHNPGGCTVTVTAYAEQGGVCFQVSDDGCGIPENVIESLTGTLPDTEEKPHIMGLQIVWQIFKAHGWQVIFSDSRTVHILSTQAPGPAPPRTSPRAHGISEKLHKRTESQKNADQ